MFLFLFALGVFFTSSSPSYAGWSNPFDIMEDIGPSIAYKARLNTLYSQFENRTNEKISIQITYGIPSQNFQLPEVKSSSITTLSPNSIRIFSPDEEKFRNYFIFTITINNINVFDNAEWTNDLGKFCTRHFNFVKNSPTRSIENISTFNININHCFDVPINQSVRFLDEIEINKS